MIYNSADFMRTPWETIIKVYRKQLGDKSFKTVSEYQKDFIAFLRKKKFYTTPETQKRFLHGFGSYVVNTVLSDLANQNQELIKKPTQANQRKFIALLDTMLDGLISEWENANFCDGFVDYAFEDFEAYSTTVLNNNYRATHLGLISLDPSIGYRLMKYTSFYNFVQDRNPVIPSVEPEEVFVNTLLQIFLITIGMHTP